MRARPAAAVAIAVGLVGCGDDAHPRILVVHGGSGTGGFVEDHADDQLSSIDDTSTAINNHGYGQLAALLRADGFELDEATEGPANDNTPVDLQAIGLDRYAIVFFASNNAAYDDAAAALVARFVHDGGGALFSSDANWGQYWDDAPTSDQTFLTQFGLIMNQDAGGVTPIDRGAFVVPSHPILAGLDSFEGEGVSPCSLSHDPAALATPVRLAAALAPVRRNTAPMGPVTAPTDDDGSLVVAAYGSGRIACTFDRNTFFNEHGEGTSLTRGGNTEYAHRLFGWLAHRI